MNIHILHHIWTRAHIHRHIERERDIYNIVKMNFRTRNVNIFFFNRWLAKTASDRVRKRQIDQFSVWHGWQRDGHTISRYIYKYIYIYVRSISFSLFLIAFAHSASNFECILVAEFGAEYSRYIHGICSYIVVILSFRSLLHWRFLYRFLWICAFVCARMYVCVAMLLMATNH